MSDIKFRVAAKTDMGLERQNNEDNFQVSANLEEFPMVWMNNQECVLSKKGALLVVADGMGGMNAGEVASEIAINTVCDYFKPENITDEIVESRKTIEKYMKSVVIEADKRIKKHAKDNPDSRGMGTTIVLAWLFDGYLYVTWCGDSRAYIFNPNTGLFQISKDHSYVQQLVDSGKITRDEAFDFPDSNIITRSLTDSTPKVEPDCLESPQKLCDGDIILLCSDGLNGMIRDREIEQVISSHQENMTECVDSLIKAALEAAGADNCTVALCQILSGGAQSDTSRIPVHNIASTEKENALSVAPDKKKNNGLWWVIIALVCVIISILVYFLNPSNCQKDFAPLKTDSITVDKKDSIQKNDTTPSVELRPIVRIPKEEKKDRKKVVESSITPHHKKLEEVKEVKENGAQKDQDEDKLTPITKEIEL